MSTPRCIATAAGLALFAACGGEIAPIEDPDAGAASGGPSQQPDAAAGSTKACSALGGVCLPEGASGPPNRKPTKSSVPLCQGTDVCWVEASSTSDVVCKTDQDCNEDPSVSALLGKCFMGVCMCQLPAHVQPSGRCGSAPPPECLKQAGTCRQDPAKCAAGELQGDMGTNMSCGDFAPAVCCFPASSCRAAVDFVCCGASTTPYEPTCENGWRTCGAGGPVPKLRSASCP